MYSYKYHASFPSSHVQPRATAHKFFLWLSIISINIIVGSYYPNRNTLTYFARILS